MSIIFLSFDRRKTHLVSGLHTCLICIHYQHVSPNDVYGLWLHLKDGIPTLDRISPCVE